MNDVSLGEEGLLYKEEVVEAKEELDKQDREILEKYLSKLASYSKPEMAKKPELTGPEHYKLRKEIIPEMFPDRDVGLKEVRTAIRIHFYKGQVPDEALYKDAGRGEIQQ